MPTFPLIQDGTQDDWWNTTGKSQETEGLGDAMKASAQQAVDSSPVAVVGDLYAMHKLGQIQGQKTLSQEELNAKYPGIQWKGPQKEGVAEYIAKEQERRQALEQRIELAGGGAVQGTLNFATKMFINYPEYALAGGAVGGAMRLAGAIPTEMVAGQAVDAGMGLGRRFATGFAENAIGVAPIELANAYRDHQEMMDTGMTGVLKNMAFAGLLGGAIHGAFGARPGNAERLRAGMERDAFNRGDWYGPPEMHPEERLAIQEAAANQMLEKKRPMIQPLLNFIARERSGEGPRPDVDHSGRAGNPYQELGPREDVSGTFFNAAPGRVEDGRLVPPQPVTADGVYLGTGQRGVSDLFRANADAAQTKGLVHQMGIDSKKMAPVDAPMPKKVSQVVEKALAELGVKPPEEGAHIGDVYQHLKPEQVDQVNRALQDAGYDGLHYEGGETGNKHNGVVVFPERAPDVVDHQQALEHDPRFVGTPTPEELQQYMEAYNAPQNELLHSEDDEARLAEVDKRIQEGSVSPDDQSFLDDQHEQAMEKAAELLKDEDLPEEDRQLLEQMREMNAPEPKPEGAVEKPEDSPDSMAPVQEEAKSAEALSMKEAASIGERAIKAVYNCIGSS